VTASVAVEEVLLFLKVGFLLLLYLFIWRIVRVASRDLRTPQESFVLAPQQRAAVARHPAEPEHSGQLVVVDSRTLKEGEAHVLGPAPLTVGRGPQNDLPLGEDQYASAQHARFESGSTGVWVVDLGSTNGTFVNGDRVDGPRRLEPGDLIRVGNTDFRFET
jgi:hypothetical protein